MNLSTREQLLVFLSVLLFAFYFYYSLILNPLLLSINNNSNKVFQTRSFIAQRMSSSNPMAKVKNPTINLLPQESQMTYIINYLNSKIKSNDLQLLSLTQFSADHKISVDLGLLGDYQGLFNFLNSLESANTFLYVDSADISPQGKNIGLKIRIIFAYK